MLRILIKKKNNEFDKINLLGHAEYSEYGKDIVCSSASSIMITTVNAIMMFDKTYITYEQKKDAFLIKINKGLLLPISHPNYYDGRVDIEIYNENAYSIQIDGKTYSINSDTFSKIKKVVEQYLEKMIYYSKIETQEFLQENVFEGGSPGSVLVKYGQLMICLRGQVYGEIGNLCSTIINEIITLIINNDSIKNNNDKFTYKENEIKIAKSQCELCKYNDESMPYKCEVYPNGKLQEIILNTKKCSYLTTKNEIL